MPAKWQRWMPLEIDALKGSPAVQAMHPAARSGYIFLLLDAWQTDDCTIPSDPIDLADKSGLGDELWAAYGIRILRKFERIDGSDRLRNLPQYERWQAAKAVYEKRQYNADRTNKLRLPSENQTITERSASRSASSVDLPLQPPLTGTETPTEIKEQKQKPSRKKSEEPSKTALKKSRHSEFKAAIEKYWQSKNPNVEMPWGPPEGKNLAIWMDTCPKLSLEEFTIFLRNRFRSEVLHSERPSRWISNLTNFANGPINRFNQPLIQGEKTHGRQPDPERDAKLTAAAEKTLAQFA